ncbi:MAG: hypothetical protein ACI841_005410 [Planctomycetota bacterium]|jgi:hypothetical protein
MRSANRERFASRALAWLAGSVLAVGMILHLGIADHSRGALVAAHNSDLPAARQISELDTGDEGAGQLLLSSQIASAPIRLLQNPQRPSARIQLELCETNGDPIPASRISLDEWGEEWISEVVDENGRLELDIPPGRYTIRVDERTLPPDRLGPKVAEITRAGDTVRTPLSKPIHFDGREDLRITLRATRSARVHGSVRDMNGRMLVGAIVRLEATGLRAGALVREGRTDEDGNFAIGSLSAGAWLAFVEPPRNESPGQEVQGVPPLPTRIELREGACVPFELVLSTSEQPWRGRLVWADSSPCAGHRVRVVYAGSESDIHSGLSRARLSTWTAITGDDGSFELCGLPATPMRLVASTEPVLGAGSRRGVAREVALPTWALLEGAQSNDLGSISIPLAAPFRLEGSIADGGPEGPAFEDLSVELIGSDRRKHAIHLDAHGSFKWASPQPPDELEIRIRRGHLLLFEESIRAHPSARVERHGISLDT